MLLDHSRNDLNTRRNSLGHTHAVVAYAKDEYELVDSGALRQMLRWSAHLRREGRKAVALPLADIDGLRA